MKRLQRQRNFLESILRESNRYKREELLLHANTDQINTVSEIVLNLLKNKIPLSPPIMARLKRYKNMVGKRKHSVKRRRQHLISQKGGGFWKSLNAVFCQCLRR